MSAPAPDIDRILEAVRAEATARGAKGGVGGYSMRPAAGDAALAASACGLPQLEITHVADFLSLPLDVFLDASYRRILGREPDAGGHSHYQRALLRGTLTRIEVLGRLRLSPEGRRRGAAIPGLLAGFALATAYRVPVAGWIASVLARVLGFPPHCQDRRIAESTALAAGAWMKR